MWLQVQQIWVEPLVPDLTDPFTVRASTVLVQLTEEDLCSSVSIGDIVDVVGQASLSHQAGKVNSKLLGDVQVSLLAQILMAGSLVRSLSVHSSIIFTSNHISEQPSRITLTSCCGQM